MLRAVMMAAVLWTGPALADDDFDRPALLALADPALQPALEAADQHVLVVRHARKISPDCNGMSCPLSAQGEAMVVRLTELIGAPPVDRAYASAACRTRLTAAAGGREVVAHQAVDGYAVDCTEGEMIERPRSDAFRETRQEPVRWTLTGEHSNTSCLWMVEFAGPEAAGEAGCNAEGRLAETAYGDVFWLYRTGEDWHLTVLPGAFEVDAD